MLRQLAVGFALGLVSSAVLATVPQRWVPRWLQVQRVEVGTPAPTARATASVESASRRKLLALEPHVTSEPSPTPPPAPASKAAKSAPLSALPRVPDAQAVSSGSTGTWERVAASLRRGHEREAITALEELAASEDAATRDAALLSRAQLDLAAGRKADALPVLRTLSRSGATPYVRARALEALAGEP